MVCSEEYYLCNWEEYGKLLANILIPLCLAIKLLKINQSSISWKSTCFLLPRQDFLTVLPSDLWFMRFSSLTKGIRFYTWPWMIAGRLSNPSSNFLFFCFLWPQAASSHAQNAQNSTKLPPCTVLPSPAPGLRRLLPLSPWTLSLILVQWTCQPHRACLPGDSLRVKSCSSCKVHIICFLSLTITVLYCLMSSMTNVLKTTF